MFGLDTSEVVMTADGKWVPRWATDECYQSMKALNELWRAGYMDPEAFSQDSASWNKKIRGTQYAIFVGSYGEADAYNQNGTAFTNIDDQWKWFESYGQTVINKISGGAKALGTAYNPFPSSRMSLSREDAEGRNPEIRRLRRMAQHGRRPVQRRLRRMAE